MNEEAGPSGMTWRQINETIKRLREDVAVLSEGGQKQLVADIMAHVHRLEDERRRIDPRPHTM